MLYGRWIEGKHEARREAAGLCDSCSSGEFPPLCGASASHRTRCRFLPLFVDDRSERSRSPTETFLRGERQTEPQRPQESGRCGSQIPSCCRQPICELAAEFINSIASAGTR